ncbi:glutamate--cysteine ligase [Echinimonas agarilytica]|uniref:Glutamate--cysteine ligase n=1 Tax=Echinimonas agarilytica TaxID=1215918 RepID=A0AA41W8A6_9GAMM|nr:glutamate--cysteine ligase [Echinimonas agarilytica]MCM2680473.1 glutamate--cysteine ligase [Echinimonas agarilytica]
MNQDISERLALLSETDISRTLQPLQRGIEKESLRIDAAGSLSRKPHPKGLGSALTHPAITTDFAENLVEFITPVSSNIDDSLSLLTDVHKFALSNMPDEQFWPMSMPCYVDGEQTIQPAQYGTSNIAQMKTLYRKGLHLRYGSMMQIISGVHYNFSMPDEFWPEWQRIKDQMDMSADEFRSHSYMGLLRNYYRYAWLIPYLFGASPALCSSFIKGKESVLPFKKVGQGTLYLPYATSLRLSDLGYTNSSQSELYVCHNSLEDYVKCLQKAISTPSKEYDSLGLKNAQGEYQQLNTNVLQIENELYSPIRPKRVAKSGETPTQALRRGGIEYIEVRSLDVNPFSPIGIDKLTIAFVDLLLCMCLFEDSGPRDQDDQQRAKDNLMKVVLEGRKPGLMLTRKAGEESLQSWALDIFDRLEPIAKMLDRDQKTPIYQQALHAQRRKAQHSNLTPSGRILERLLSSGEDNGKFGIELAQNYRNLLSSIPYGANTEDYWNSVAAESYVQQQAIEKSDDVSFEDFLKDYFERNQQPFTG